MNLRRIAFHGATPGSFLGLQIKIAQWETDFEAAVKANATDLFNFEQDVHHANFSKMMMREGPDPAMGWPIVIATGKRIRVHWGEANDFETMTYDRSPRWTESDLTAKIMTNFTDVRMSINNTDRGGV